MKKNHVGSFTKPAPHLYPHQWSWDSAFVAIGWSNFDLETAYQEIETLLDAQWSDGRIPHIVFNPEEQNYFPGPEVWNCQNLTELAPKHVKTTGLIQPPVHSFAAKILWERTKSSGKESQYRDRIEAIFEKLLSWHRYLAKFRDPENTGLISIYHPWESGTDNSPRWDEVMASLKPDEVPAFERRDTKFVTDISERPTDEEYVKYIWLVESMKKLSYDDLKLSKEHPFLIKDALMSGIFALATKALSTLGERLGKSDDVLSELKSTEKKTTEGLLQLSFDESSSLSLDLDMRNERKRINVSTCAGLSTILLPDLDKAMAETSCKQIMGENFAHHKELKFAVIPSTTPHTPGYKENSYWRGPTWPVLNWLFWYAINMHGFEKEAAALRQANIDLLAEENACFGEYLNAITGKQLGSADQSWTAAVLIEWLSNS